MNNTEALVPGCDASLWSKPCITVKLQSTVCSLLLNICRTCICHVILQYRVSMT